MIRALSLLAAYLCAAIAFLGALFQFGHVWVLSWVLAGCVCVIVWGLAKALADQVDDDGHCPACDHPFGELDHACIGPIVDRGTYIQPTAFGVPLDDERELPYKRPVWDNAIGAPE